MAQFFSTIGRHLECAIQTELVVELELALIDKTYPPPRGYVTRKEAHHLNT